MSIFIRAHAFATRLLQPQNLQLLRCPSSRIQGLQIQSFSSSSQPKRPERVLITGCLGQLGPVLATFLEKKYGPDSVVATDIRRPLETQNVPNFRYLDVLSLSDFHRTIVNEGITILIHFSVLLSAVGELNVPQAIRINILGMQNALEAARLHRLKVFIPSTIGAFGPESPLELTPNLTIQRPKTIYGVSKVYCELLGEYYYHRFGLDFRSLRFPGVISSDSEPGGGTTDYAVEIFHKAMREGRYTCYLSENRRLPMMHINDCLRSILELLDAPLKNTRTYNVAGMSFTPAELAVEIAKQLGLKDGLKMTYEVDPVREKIAEAWPRVLDDSEAQKDWGWKAEFDSTEKIVTKMLTDLKQRDAAKDKRLHA